MRLPNYLVLDIENDNSSVYKRNAGNFLYDKIVAVGYKNQSINKALYYKDETRREQVLPWTQHIPSSIQLLVGHNIKHDLLFLWKEERLQYLLQQGLKIWDTAQAEYILTGQEHQYPALRDIAVNKYGCKLREKVMEPYWDKGIQTSDIPKELVLEDVKNDVLDTEQVFVRQWTYVVAKGIMPLIEAENDTLLATAEMEYNGMFVDKHIISATRYYLEQDLDVKKKELDLIINEVWK